MAFSSFFNSRLTEPLMLQLAAILQRDIDSSLTEVATLYNEPKLPNFVEWNLAFYEPTQWPAILIVPKTTQFVRPQEVQARPQAVSIELTVADSNQDRNLLAQHVWRYILAIDKIVASLGAQVNVSNTPNFNDFYTPLPVYIPFPQDINRSVIKPIATLGMQTGSVLACYPTGLSYSQTVARANSLALSATLSLRIDVEET